MGNRRKKAAPLLMLLSPPAVRTTVLETRLCDPVLFLNLSPDSCQSYQAKAEKEHRGGFGH